MNYWTGTEEAIRAAAALCDAAVLAVPEMRGDVVVPEAERVTTCWDVPRQRDDGQWEIVGHPHVAPPDSIVVEARD
jgi:hypothetical protein